MTDKICPHCGTARPPTAEGFCPDCSMAVAPAPSEDSGEYHIIEPAPRPSFGRQLFDAWAGLHALGCAVTGIMLLGMLCMEALKGRVWATIIVGWFAVSAVAVWARRYFYWSKFARPADSESEDSGDEKPN